MRTMIELPLVVGNRRVKSRSETNMCHCLKCAILSSTEVEISHDDYQLSVCCRLTAAFQTFQGKDHILL